MWGDSFFSELDKDKKLFYIYLLTNEKTKQCGVYEITKKQIAFDLEYSIGTVSILLKYFIKLGKIRYNEQTSELALKNWHKYNASTSPKVVACMDKEFAMVKDTVLIQYVKGIDTDPQEEEEKEKEEEQEQETILKIVKIDFIEFWNLYDKKTGDKSKLIKKWNSFSLELQNEILEYIPLYKLSQPKKQFRKNAETFFNQKGWEDELISAESNTQTTTKQVISNQPSCDYSNPEDLIWKTSEEN